MLGNDFVQLVQQRKKLGLNFKIKRQGVSLHGKRKIIFILRPKQL